MAQNMSESGNGSGSANPQPVTMDLTIALERMDGDATLLGEIMDIFLEEHLDGLKQLRAAAQAGDRIRMQSAAHTLKGAVGNFVAVDAAHLALQLEHACQGGDVAAGLALVEPLEQEISRLAAALRRQRQKDAA